MTSMTIEQALEAAMQRHQAGKLREAELLYRQILAQQPNYPDALHLLGLVAFQSGQMEPAQELIRKAISIFPSAPDYHLNLGHVLLALLRPREAAEEYRQAIALRFDDPQSHLSLGNALKQLDDLNGAINSIRQAIALRPGYALAHLTLGNVLFVARQLDEAAAAYQRATELQPDYPQAWSNLGNIFREQGKLQEAIAHGRRAIQLRPDFSEGLNNLALSLSDAGQFDEAITLYRKSLMLQPDSADTLNNLANALFKRGRLDEAIKSLDRAVALRPNNANGWSNRSFVLRDLGRLEESIASARRAIALRPDLPEAHQNLSTALLDIGSLEESAIAATRAIELRPDLAPAHNNLGNIARENGDVASAINHFNRAISLNPRDSALHSNKLYALQFHPDYDAPSLLAEQREWNRIHAIPVGPSSKKFVNDRSPDRRLRVGYVSPHFYAHAESFFIVPLLESHDHQNFEIFCYATVPRPDSITRRLQKAADHWIDATQLNDAELAERITVDKIDLLIDLTMHMANNRAMTFARKPAPVQIAWLAYPGGTGMDAMDWRITDSFMDPPAPSIDADYAEKSFRLTGCWCCYNPLTEIPKVEPRPAGPIRFGSLNNPCKLNHSTLSLWAQILARIPDSTLLVQAIGQQHRNKIQNLFASQNVALNRLTFVARSARPDYLKLYHQIDLCLDPLPYNGITTTCDALWMGVPVISLAGKKAAGRAGLSLLSNVGLSELVAQTPSQFSDLAVNLANDPARLAQLHVELRKKMQTSPLMDARGFAKNMESAFRSIWRQWCVATKPT